MRKRPPGRSSSIRCPIPPTRTSRTSTPRRWKSITIGTTQPMSTISMASWRSNPISPKRPLLELLTDLNSVPEAVRTTVRNNGGGHANHTMFWQIMGGAGGEPKGDVKAAIDRDFGGFDKLQDQFNTAGTRVFGSGWVFVTVARDGKLALVTKPNQDTPLMDGQRTLMGNDVWEHAYYLKYQNRRPDYLKAWWNVVNWDKVSERYSAAKAGTLTI